MPNIKTFKPGTFITRTKAVNGDSSYMGDHLLVVKSEEHRVQLQSPLDISITNPTVGDWAENWAEVRPVTKEEIQEVIESLQRQLKEFYA